MGTADGGLAAGLDAPEACALGVGGSRLPAPGGMPGGAGAPDITPGTGSAGGVRFGGMGRFRESLCNHTAPAGWILSFVAKKAATERPRRDRWRSRMAT